MSAVDVKYVVIVEYINDVKLRDAVAFYATEASYAAGLTESFTHAGKIVMPGKYAPYLGVMQEYPVSKVTYAGV